jgi:serine/threonine protein kinase
MKTNADPFILHINAAYVEKLKWGPSFASRLMPENLPSSIEPELSTTSGEKLCTICGKSSCGHSTTTNNITDTGERTKPRRKPAELPVELEEFSANYEIQGLVGEGGMSAVYRAQHRALNKPMAIKMLHSHLVRDVVQRKRFEQEAQALFLLEHQNIVKLRDFGSTTTGKPFLIMDFLKGKPLSEILRSEGPLPVHRALQMFLQICDALDHAHGKSIIHRDIKPSNIVIVEDDGKDSVRIVDFGIAKFAQEDINPGLTQTGDVFGSPLYMSPEQCLGQKLDSRSDTYAFGCVMYEVLSGKPPLAGETALATIHKHTSENPKPLQVPDCDPKLRQRLDEIIFKTLEKDPDKRYQSMALLKADLQELSNDTGYRKATGYYVRYARAHRQALNAMKRHPIQIVALVTVLTALVSFAAYTVVERSESLLRAPQPLNAELDWRWLAKPVAPIPVDFMDKLRLARMIMYSAENRRGFDDERIKTLHRSFAEQMLKYGYWDEAIAHLLSARDGYSKEDPVVSDINHIIGDIYVEKKEWSSAATAYNDAMAGYARLHSKADNSEALAKLKYGWALVRKGDFTKAFANFDLRNLKTGNSGFEATMSASGKADCELAMAEDEHNNRDRRTELLHDARTGYTSARSTWKNFSIHDSVLCSVRLGDTYIVEGNWKEARDEYQKAMQDLSVFNDQETAQMEQNYARLLLRNWNLVDALRMDDLAKDAAKHASERRNEQNAKRFSPEDSS